MELHQSSQYAQYLKLRGWQVEKVKGSYIFIRKIPLTPFSIIKAQRPKKIPFEKIDQLAKRYHALAIYLEPTTNYQLSAINKKDSRLSRSSFLPTKTIRLDLSQSQERILSQMKKDARYSIKKSIKESLQIIEVKNLARFRRAWKKSVDWRRWVPSLKSLRVLKKAFGQRAIVLAAENQEKIIAGTIILATNSSAYYFYAFTSKEGRKKLAQYSLVWEAIKLAKKQGCRIFDFEGIYDERFPVKSWQGFSHFKKSFGGKEIKYPGCFVKYRLPF